MKRFINTLTSGLANGVLFLVGCVMAGLGLMVMFGMSLVALTAVGLAILAAPFVRLAMPRNDARAEV